jgi:hypothetical protein
MILVLAVQLHGQAVNPDSASLQDFGKRVAYYAQLRKAAASKLPALRATASQEKIVEQQKALAREIVKARQSAKQGDLFTPSVDREFRRLIHLAMPPGDAPRIRKSLQNAEPVAALTQINHPYPSGVPLQTTPPSILLNLPRLPADIEYRLVNRTLVLWDAKANLIIDMMDNVDL